MKTRKQRAVALNRILDLPKDVLIRLISQYLTMKELCRLDTSICQHDKRQYFLECIGSDAATFHGIA
jgi:hypothetical protein